jgi:superoxide reductase
MIKKKTVYFCENCGNVLEALWDGTGEVKCCGQQMTELKSKTTGADEEIHTPVIKREGSKVTVTVGEEPHPMLRDDHCIVFIELLAEDKVLRHDFKEGDKKAEASFLVEEGVPVKARAFCNLDDLWETS